MTPYLSVRELRNNLSRRIDEVLKPLVPPGTDCALIDFPNYANAGDSAIWLGEKSWLDRNGNPIVYTCDLHTYHKERLKSRIGNGIIFLQGGGNFGDLWEGHQLLRERVVRDFPDHRIILFPQTIYFEKKEALRRAAAIFNAHPRLTMLCRDTASLTIAAEAFTATLFLCPDMAFAIGRTGRPVPPGVDIVWLSRTDKESRNGARPGQVEGIIRTDWLEEEITGLHRENAALMKALKKGGTADVYAQYVATLEALAHHRFREGCTILSRGQVVITDRLHAHILCLLMEIPHVVLDNSYGKVRGFYETWTKNNELTAWAESPESAVFLAGNDHRITAAVQKDGAVLESLSATTQRLRSAWDGRSGWTTPEQDRLEQWKARLQRVKETIAAHIPESTSYILLDENIACDHLGLPGRKMIPFMEKDEEYWGLPAEDRDAISELERLRTNGASYLVILWSSFWWEDGFPQFYHYIRKFPALLRSEEVVILDLRIKDGLPEAPGSEAPVATYPGVDEVI